MEEFQILALMMRRLAAITFLYSTFGAAIAMFVSFSSVTSLMMGGRGIPDARPLDRFGLTYFYLGLSEANLINLVPIDQNQCNKI